MHWTLTVDSASLGSRTSLMTQNFGVFEEALSMTVYFARSATSVLILTMLWFTYSIAVGNGPSQTYKYCWLGQEKDPSHRGKSVVIIESWVVGHKATTCGRCSVSFLVPSATSSGHKQS